MKLRMLGALVTLGAVMVIVSASIGPVTRWEVIVWSCITVGWVGTALLYEDLWKRQVTRRVAESTHPGVRLRIVHGAAGPLIDIDSDQLHYSARFGSREDPGRGWYELFPGENMTYMGERSLLIQVKPVTLGCPRNDDD